MIPDLIKLADKLDKSGLIKEADLIDSLIKTAFNKKVKDLFWAKVKKTPKCWIWMGAKAKNGYGILTIAGKNYSAHRLAWEWANKRKIPKGYVLLHSCDDPNCVKPAHLKPGTQQSNVDDRGYKDRSAKGENNGMSRLKEKDIKTIRALRERGLTEHEIAQLFNITRSAVANILHERTWAWVR